MGVQTIDRAVAILHWLGNSGEQGMRLVELQRALGLKRPTVHRILASLMEHGLVSNDSRTHLYRLGWEAAVLGWSSVPVGFDLRETAQGAMSRLAEETGATALLCACSRRETVCIDRRAGNYPIKVFTVEVGTRRPLGVGAGSIAALASLPEEEAGTVIKGLMEPLQAYPEALRRSIVPSVRLARKAGYAVSDGLVLPTVIGVGVALRDPRGVAIGTLGIASFKDSASDKRISDYAQLLLREKSRIERAFRDKMMARAKTQALAPRPVATRPPVSREAPPVNR